jgi:UPF0271 protein
MARLIELNADVGEGWDDERIFSCVDRVSIACGGHAGDETSMRVALQLCSQKKVKAGAHPSYPDREHFGRQPMEASPGDISGWITEQTLHLIELASQLDVGVFHVKPHGALYNLAADNRLIADEVIAAMKNLTGLALVVLAGSPMATWAREAGIEVLEEAFADRRYLSNGRLVPRSVSGAMIERSWAVTEQALRIARGQPVATFDEKEIRVRADTLCFHGDSSNAASLASAVRAVLNEA